MSVFNEKDRIRKVWNSFRQTFRRVRPDAESHQQELDAINHKSAKRLLHKKPLIMASGAVALLLIAGFSGNEFVKANTTDFYEVYQDGQLVGSVATQAQVEELVAKKEQDVKASNPGITIVLDTGELTYERKREFKAEPDTAGTLKKLEGLFKSHANGVELKVDGKTVAVVKDQATADKILASVKSRFAPQSSKNKAPEVTALAYTAEATADKPSTEIKSVKIVEDVTTAKASVDPDQIADAGVVYAKLVQGTIKPTKYTVQEGDCVGCIAQKFEISPQVIYENNNWIEDDMIKVGDVLDLTVKQPEVTVETVERLTEIETIEPSTVIQKSSSMRAGESKVIREGKSGSKKIVYQLTKQNGYLMSEELLGEQLIEYSVPTIIMKGTKVVLGEGSGNFAWPVSGARLTSSYGKRWGRLHKGIDMVGGSTIKAADDGIVTFAGYSDGGLGYHVIINHQNGYTTTYGHMSKVTVKKGQTVEKGDALGVMGNTGHSFGTHLHFEIQKNGVIQNPIKYL